MQNSHKYLSNDQRMMLARKKSGSAAVIMIILLSMIAATAGFMVQARSAGRVQQLRQHHILQTQFMLQAGLHRALQRIQKDSEYPGETWNIPVGELYDNYNSQVIIGIAAVPDQPEFRKLTLTVNFPTEGIHQIRQTKNYQIQIQQK